MKPNFDWKRFWVQRESRLVLDGEGYLEDPDAEYGALTNPHALPYAAIDSLPCLVLLGEPGIGKSKAIRDALATAEASADSPADRIVFKDLNEYSSEDRLVRDVFEIPEFREWQHGSGRLYLILDSLDECLLRIDTVSNIFAQKFAGLPSDRLSVRIACRTAAWPSQFEEALRSVWDDDNVGVYELAPLRRRDVALAASEEGLNPDQFLHAIRDRNVAPLAAKPITLLFLLNTFRRRAGFPQDQAGLYAEGCRLLCEEPNESRRTGRRTGSLSTDERLVVASRIAACTVFSNRAGIWTRRDYGDVPEEYIAVREMAGGTESINGSEFGVTQKEIQEVLDTGLFTSRGENRMGWAHETYAEFLAAHYCVLHNMTQGQLMGLLVHPEDPEGGLVPQLSGFAAWIATDLRGIFEDVCKRSPEVLLRADLSALDDSAREAFVAALLIGFEFGKLRDSYGLASQFHRLVHSGLNRQLRPYLRDTSRPEMVRDVAVDIAEACGLTDLQEDLVSIALDTKEVDHLRANAALAVARIGGEQARLALKPIAAGEIPGDAHDELKGATLQALWPGLISLEELLVMLTPPRGGFIGLYWMFLSTRLAHGIQVEDLPTALDWVSSHSNKEHRSHNPYDDAMDSIMLKAWDHLDVPGVSEAFARAALARIIERPDILRRRHGLGQEEDALKKDPARRLPSLDSRRLRQVSQLWEPNPA